MLLANQNPRSGGRSKSREFVQVPKDGIFLQYQTAVQNFPCFLLNTCMAWTSSRCMVQHEPISLVMRSQRFPTFGTSIKEG